jgi:hypothetical protein
MPPKVSVVTPAYNHQKFIRQCMDSVLAQSVEDWEMIVVDDGSTDDTASLVEAEPNPRIRLIRQENKGLSRLCETYNRALGEAQGEFVAILEGDDYWPWNKLEAQLEDLEDPEVALCFGQFNVVNEDGVVSSTEPKESPPSEALTNSPLGRAVYWLARPSFLTFAFPVTLVMRRNALLRVGGFQQTRHLPLVDYPTLLAMATAGRWSYHEAVMGYWRRHQASTTLSQLPRILTGALRTSREFIESRRDALPLIQADLDHLAWERASFQHERALLAHRWALHDGRKEDAKAFLSLAGRLARGKVAKARVAAAQALLALGRSTEPALLPKRGPWQHRVKVNEFDYFVTPETTVSDLEVI